MERRNFHWKRAGDTFLKHINEDNLYFSDSETSSIGCEIDSAIIKNYWFGKKYFECALAQKVLRENVVENAFSILDVRYLSACHVTRSTFCC